VEQYTRRPLGHCSTLFPLLNGAWIQPEAYGKFRLREPEALSNAAHVRGSDDDMADIAIHGIDSVGKPLMFDLRFGGRADPLPIGTPFAPFNLLVRAPNHIPNVPFAMQIELK
jgi:hypothetical protein